MIDTLLSLIEHIGWFGGYAVATWLCAYVLRVTAPQSCPRGRDYEACRNDHFAHVDRNDSKTALVFGLGWPIWLIGFTFLMLAKSIDGAAHITPMPTPKVGRVNTDKMLESAEKENEEGAAAIEALRIEQLNRRHAEEQAKQDHHWVQGRVLEGDE